VQTSLQTKIMPNTDLFSKQKLIYLRLSNYGHNLIFVEKTSVRYKVRQWIGLILAVSKMQIHPLFIYT
jgi:hypothetical protein